MPSAAPPVRTAAGVIIPTSADGSVRQVSLVVSAALTVAAAWGYACPAKCEEIDGMLDRIRALLFGLMRRKGK